MIQRNKIDETKILFANEQRLEDAALKSLMQSEVSKKKREIPRILVKEILMQCIWCKFIVENENKQELNHHIDIKSGNKTKSSTNKRRRFNDKNTQFENISSEIIDDDIAVLIPLNDMPTIMAEEVARSNTIREKRKIKRQKNNYNNNINRINNQYPRNNAQQTCNQPNANNHNRNRNINQNNQNQNQPNNRVQFQN